MPSLLPSCPLPAAAAALVAAVACLAPPSARAELPAPALAGAAQLARDAATALAPKGARVLATPGAPDSRLRLAPCARIEPQLVAGQPAWGRTRVGLRCTSGAAWSIFVPVTVQVLAPALAPRAPLPAGARLEADQLERVETDWAAAPTAPTLDAQALIGRTLARPLAAGQAVRAADLQQRVWFAHGSPVQVWARGEGFTVSGEATSLGPGLEGQVVRVRTDNGRILSGRAVGAGRVELIL